MREHFREKLGSAPVEVAAREELELEGAGGLLGPSRELVWRDLGIVFAAEGQNGKREWFGCGAGVVADHAGVGAHDGEDGLPQAFALQHGLWHAAQADELRQ